MVEIQSSKPRQKKWQNMINRILIINVFTLFVIDTFDFLASETIDFVHKVQRIIHDNDVFHMFINIVFNSILDT